MALIKCPKCGNQMSDKAAACLHCGTPASSQPSSVNYSAPVNMTAQKTASNKTPIIIGVCIAAAAIIGVIVFLIFGSKSPQQQQNVFTPVNDTTNITGNTAEPKARYAVKITADYEKNLAVNKKVLVDILIDDIAYDTISQGEVKTYQLQLVEGSHKIEFRDNGKYKATDKNTFKIYTMNVTSNKEIAFDIKRSWISIKVSVVE